MKAVSVNRCRAYLNDSSSVSPCLPQRVPGLGNVADLPRHLISQIAGSGILPSAPFSSRRKRTLHREYDRACRTLSKFRDESKRFVSAITNQNLEFLHFHGPMARLEEDARRTFKTLSRDVFEFQHSLTPNIKTLDFLSQSAEALATQYRADIIKQADLYVNEILLLLDRLSRSGFLGQIRFGGERNENAEFTFNHYKAIACNVRQKKQKVAQTLGQMYFRDGQMWRRNTVQVETSGEIQFRHACHTHLLSEATVVPLNSWKQPFPDRVARIVDTIPTVLRPAVRVVAGVVEFIRVVEVDLAQVPFSCIDTEVTEERVRHEDPALILGDWVITGWCDGETPKMTRRRRLYANAVHFFRRVSH